MRAPRPPCASRNPPRLSPASRIARDSAAPRRDASPLDGAQKRSRSKGAAAPASSCARSASSMDWTWADRACPASRSAQCTVVPRSPRPSSPASAAEDAPPGPRLVGRQERPAHGRAEEDRVGDLDAALPRRPQARRPRPEVEARVLALHDDDVVARGPVHAVAAVRDEDEDQGPSRRRRAEEVARARGGVRRVLRVRVDDERLSRFSWMGPLRRRRRRRRVLLAGVRG